MVQFSPPQTHPPQQQSPPQHVAGTPPPGFDGFQSGAPPVNTGPQTWTSGLCGCFDDCSTCCYGTFCLPCLYGENVARVTQGGCCGPCALYYFLPCCTVCCCAPHFRRQVRHRYNLTEEPCGDCWVHFWCSPCAVCQETRELNVRDA